MEPVMADATCSVLLPDGTICGLPWRSRKIELCENHYRRKLKYGDPAITRFTPARPYDAAHHRIRKARGRAREHRCADCGAPAVQWSLNHRTVTEIQYDTDGAPDGWDTKLAYSDDVNDYSPRCRSCHLRYDLPRGEAHHAAVLTGQDCRDVVASHKSAKELAELYDTTATTINRIRSGSSRSSETGVVYKPIRGPWSADRRVARLSGSDGHRSR